MKEARADRTLKSKLASLFAVAAVAGSASARAGAQVSLTTAVDLALKNSPRVKMSLADVNRARATLSESKDVFIPVINGGSGLGYSFGFPVGQPTLFNFTAQSLVFSFAQLDYIRSARLGLVAASLGLMDVRQSVEEDATVTFASLDKDAKREAALAQEVEYSTRLAGIVEDRFNAGQDTAIDLTVAKLTAKRIHLAYLHAQDDTRNDRAHLARLMGLPEDGLTVNGADFPQLTPKEDVPKLGTEAINPGVAAAYVNARARAEQAKGDHSFLYRPQIGFGAQYDRFATSFNGYNQYYSGNVPPNNAEIGAQITVPFFDRARLARSRQTAADADHALHEADNARLATVDAQTRLANSFPELRERAEIAVLDQQLSQQQLDVLLIQLQNTVTGAPPMTPKDEQNARITERERYIAVVDSTFELRQAQIFFLRQTGQLEQQLQQIAATMVVAPRLPAQP